MNVLFPARLQSVEKASMLTREAAAMGCAARTDSANNGPSISSAPSFRASCVAVRAPSGVPRVSLGMS